METELWYVCPCSDIQGKDRKLPRPYHGPYRVLNVTHMNAKVVPVDHPRDLPIFVSLSRVRHCYVIMKTWLTYPGLDLVERGEDDAELVPKPELQILTLSLSRLLDAQSRHLIRSQCLRELDPIPGPRPGLSLIELWTKSVCSFGMHCVIVLSLTMPSRLVVWLSLDFCSRGRPPA